MEFFEVVAKRRSVRRFLSDPFPDAHVRRALEAAILAPNSSNVQTWDFDWVKKSSPYFPELVVACLNQSAARKASHLIVISSDAKRWRRSQARLIEWVKASKVSRPVLLYYERLVPYMYRWGVFNTLGLAKFLAFAVTGVFRPIMRGPSFKSEIQGVATKSAALAAENFVLAITALGGATCMMEGFDERRVKRLFGLSRSSRVTMVVAVGYEASDGTWGPQYRLPLEDVLRVHT